MGRPCQELSQLDVFAGVSHALLVDVLLNDKFIWLSSVEDRTD